VKIYKVSLENEFLRVKMIKKNVGRRIASTTRRNGKI
jgi:hypothetical protein